MVLSNTNISFVTYQQSLEVGVLCYLLLQMHIYTFRIKVCISVKEPKSSVNSRSGSCCEVLRIDIM